MRGDRRALEGKQRIVTGLPPDLLKELMTRSRTLTVEAGEVLFQAGGDGDGCYIVQAGALKATVVSVDGHERMLAVFGPGAIVGEMALVDREERSATVSAIRRSRLAHISRDRFFVFADANTAVYRHALRILAQRLRGTNEDTLAQGNATVASRVARALLLLADSIGEARAGGGRRIGLDVTQSDIAAMAGVARENASRTVSGWLKSGILEREEGRYVIADRRALHDIWSG